MSEIFTRHDLKIEDLLKRIEAIGAASVQLLQDNFRLGLLEEAESYAYKPEAEEVGSGNRIVRQQMGSFGDFSVNSKFLLLKEACQKLLDEQLAILPAYPFDTRLRLDTLSLQQYPQGSLGITPHRDGWRYINLICIFVIGGYGRFFVCEDRQGSDSIEIPAYPGNVIFMRAPGFLGSTQRPFHFVTDIRGTRYSFGLRQRRGQALPQN